jgi:hypothetical protein
LFLLYVSSLCLSPFSSLHLLLSLSNYIILSVLSLAAWFFPSFSPVGVSALCLSFFLFPFLYLFCASLLSFPSVSILSLLSVSSPSAILILVYHLPFHSTPLFHHCLVLLPEIWISSYRLMVPYVVTKISWNVIILVLHLILRSECMHYFRKNLIFREKEISQTSRKFCAFREIRNQ